MEQSYKYKPADMATLPYGWANPNELSLEQLLAENKRLQDENGLLRSGLDCSFFCALPVCVKALYEGKDDPNATPF